MSPEEKIEAAQKLIDEAREEIAAKKRNWPERIEPGMVFSEPNGSANAWFAAGVGFICISGSCLGMRRETLPTDCHYIGKDCVSIHPDAHEPTGAELVGKVTEYELGPDDVIEASDDICRHGFSERRSHNWRDSFPHGITVKDAREQCKGMIRFFRKVAR